MTGFDPPPPPPPPLQLATPIAIEQTAQQRIDNLSFDLPWPRATNGIVKSASKPILAIMIVELPIALAVKVVEVLTVTTNVPVPLNPRFRLVGETYMEVAYPELIRFYGYFQVADFSDRN